VEDVNADTPDADQLEAGERADHPDPLAVLAAAIASLSPKDRARLGALLADHQDRGVVGGHGKP